MSAGGFKVARAAAVVGWMAVDAAVHSACFVSAGTAGARVATCSSAATAANSAAAWFTLGLDLLGRPCCL
jgi:hypothetical protein